MKQKPNRHWRGPGPQPRKMFDAGSKAWARRMKGDVRRARIRALRIAERQLRPHGWRVESVRVSPRLPEYFVDVFAVPRRGEGLMDVVDVVVRGLRYAPIEWIGMTGRFSTRDELRADLKHRCRSASLVHFPECDCDDCYAVPF